nr:TraV family lipoprotein [Thiorhodovibrio frisius]
MAGEGVVRERPAVTPSGDPSPSKSAQMPASAKQRPRTPVAESNPTREPAQVIRIWIAPWEDSAGNLHGASHVFTEVVRRRWSLASATDTPATTVLTPLQIQPRQVSTSESERKP